MGDAGFFHSSHEHVLILRASDWPDSWHDKIRRQFRDIEITALTVDITKPFEETVPKDILARATVIALNTRKYLPLPESIPNIKLIHTFSAGVNQMLNEPYVKQTNLPLTTSSGIHGPPISEWILLNWLVSSKRYNALYEAQKKHEWMAREYAQWSLTDHVGKRVAILGYGSIGRQVGRIANSLGAQVYAYTASAKTTAESRKDKGYIVPGTGDPDGTYPVEWHHGTSKEELRRFLSATKPDHVVVSLPLTPATLNLFDGEEFEAWSDGFSSSTSTTDNDVVSKRKGFLTNISRGTIVNTAALIDAVQSNKIRGAALDVTDPEPLPKDHPLWDVEGVQISPHISWAGEDYYVRALDVLRVNIERLKKGEDLINLFQRRRGY